MNISFAVNVPCPKLNDPTKVSETYAPSPGPAGWQPLGAVLTPMTSTFGESTARTCVVSRSDLMIEGVPGSGITCCTKLVSTAMALSQVRRTVICDGPTIYPKAPSFKNVTPLPVKPIG